MSSDILTTKEDEHSEDSHLMHATFEHQNPYSTWEQVSGHFDGDGTVGVMITKFGFAIWLVFVDNYKPLLEHIASFLQQRGFSSTFFFHRPNGRSSWRLSVKRKDDVIGILKLMLPHLDKKREEARVAIDYLTDLTDGAECARRTNNQVKIGERLGRGPFAKTSIFSNPKGRHLDSRGQQPRGGIKVGLPPKSSRKS